MSHLDTQSLPRPQNPKSEPPDRWVRTRLEGSGKYSLSVVGATKRPVKADGEQNRGCAYAKLSLMGSGAVMASFPVMGMVSGTIRAMLGANCFELESPLILPAFVFGYEIEIPAGRHPIVFVLESWVVLFRPLL